MAAGVIDRGEPVAINAPAEYQTTVEPLAHVAEILVEEPAHIVFPALEDKPVGLATTGNTVTTISCAEVLTLSHAVSVVLHLAV